MIPLQNSIQKLNKLENLQFEEYNTNNIILKLFIKKERLKMQTIFMIYFFIFIKIDNFQVYFFLFIKSVGKFLIKKYIKY